MGSVLVFYLSSSFSFSFSFSYYYHSYYSYLSTTYSTLLSSLSAISISSGVVILIFLRSPSTSDIRTPSDSTTEASSVKRGSKGCS